VQIIEVKDECNTAVANCKNWYCWVLFHEVHKITFFWFINKRCLETSDNAKQLQVDISNMANFSKIRNLDRHFWH